MLMDLFFESTRVSKKQRVHFNAFMLDVHDSKLCVPDATLKPGGKIFLEL